MKIVLLVGLDAPWGSFQSWELYFCDSSKLHSFTVLLRLKLHYFILTHSIMSEVLRSSSFQNCKCVVLNSGASYFYWLCCIMKLLLYNVELSQWCLKLQVLMSFRTLGCTVHVFASSVFPLTFKLKQEEMIVAPSDSHVFLFFLKNLFLFLNLLLS